MAFGLLVPRKVLDGVMDGFMTLDDRPGMAT